MRLERRHRALPDHTMQKPKGMPYTPAARSSIGVVGTSTTMPSVIAAAKLAETSSGAVSFAARTLSEASLSAAVHRSVVATRIATHAATTTAATAAPTTTFVDGMQGSTRQVIEEGRNDGRRRSFMPRPSWAKKFQPP